MVQLTGLREGGKDVCAQYWPSEDTQRQRSFGEFHIQLENEERLEGHTIRNFTLTRDKVCVATLHGTDPKQVS